MGQTFKPIDYGDLGNDVIVLDVEIAKLKPSERIYAERVAWQGKGDQPRFCIWHENELVPISEEFLKSKTIIVPWTDSTVPREDMRAVASQLPKHSLNRRKLRQQALRQVELPPQFFWTDDSGGVQHIGSHDLTSAAVFVDFDVDKPGDSSGPIRGVRLDGAAPGFYGRRAGQMVRLPDNSLNNKKFFLSSDARLFSLCSDDVVDLDGKISQSSDAHPLFFISKGGAATEATSADFENDMIVVDQELYQDYRGRSKKSKSSRSDSRLLRAMRFQAGPATVFKPGLYARNSAGQLALIPDSDTAKQLQGRAVVVSDWLDTPDVSIADASVVTNHSQK